MKNNELIDEFMGANPIEDIPYDKDWNLLMPVVERINYANDNNVIHIDEDVIYLHMSSKMKSFEHAKKSGEKIKAVYNAVLYCIKNI